MSTFDHLLSNEYQDLYRFALSLSRDPERAEDLTHDSVVRAIERSNQFQGAPSQLGAWLRSILHNLAVDRSRKSAREILVEEVENKWRDDDYTVDPEQFVLNMQDRTEVEDALARLPFIYRVPVILHDIEGWKVREIADIAGIGLPAAKQRLRRGRMAMVTALAESSERREALKGVPMHCWDARKHISDYLDGTLEPSLARTVEAHLETCPTCPPLYAALVETKNTMNDLRDPDSVIPPHLGTRLRKAIDDRRKPSTK